MSGVTCLGFILKTNSGAESRISNLLIASPMFCLYLGVRQLVVIYNGLLDVCVCEGGAPLDFSLHHFPSSS